jgi:hypothetical protein
VFTVVRVAILSTLLIAWAGLLLAAERPPADSPKPEDFLKLNVPAAPLRITDVRAAVFNNDGILGHRGKAIALRIDAEGGAYGLCLNYAGNTELDNYKKTLSKARELLVGRDANQVETI